MGCDPSNILTNVAKERVSIHAPAWGATIKKSLPKTAYVGFNPRTRVGCDHSWVPLILTSSAFQSTHPRGVRHDLRAIEDLRHAVSIHAPAWGATFASSISLRFVTRFNPRTRVGCDIPGRRDIVANSGFNPRTRVGCDLLLSRLRTRKLSFNPRTRVGCDFRCTCRASRACGFNPRTRVGCDRQRLMLARTLSLFQSTHPRGVRHPFVKDFTGRSWFQSTHPRGVRLRAACMAMSHFMVSIHAPAWGATRASEARMPSVFKFQSTHPRGVRHTDMYLYGLECRFQSTHPRGVRRISNTPSDAVLRVSIHAPAWGATMLRAPQILNFSFQSTHPRGVRHLDMDDRVTWVDVSIHAPAWGATVEVVAMGTVADVSIHAPAWGATHDGSHKGRTTQKFQSTHPRGVRPVENRQLPRQKWFQSTHPRGVRRVADQDKVFGYQFQSTHPRGVRRSLCPASVWSRKFQSTHPRGVRHPFVRDKSGRLMFQSTHPRGVRPADACG